VSRVGSSDPEDFFLMHLDMLSGTSSEGLSNPSFMASDHPASLVCLSDLADSDNPTLLSFAELVQFNVSLSSFFVFCFARAFYFILGI